MADPRQFGPGLGQSIKTITQQQLDASARNEKLNLCPCGCDDDAINEHGYCPHLIGFTVDGKEYEPREIEPYPGCPERVNGAAKQPITDDLILVPITNTSRVYKGKRVIRPSPLSETEELRKQLEELKTQIADLRQGKKPKRELVAVGEGE